jgi:hypothetical protein
MSQGIIISRAHRDALYGSLLLLLGQFGDLETFGDSSEPEEIATCERAGRRLTGILRLIQEGGLGWGYPEDDGIVRMTLPPEDLRRLLTEQRRLFVEHQEATRSDREGTESEWKLADEAREACTAVLEQIGERIES